MEDQAQTISLAGPKAADAVAHHHTVIAARTSHRPVAGGEEDTLAFFHTDGLGARLGAGALFVEQEFAAAVITPVLVQDAGSLQGKGYLAVQILMQAVVIARLVTQDQRCWAGLMVLVTEGKE